MFLIVWRFGRLAIHFKAALQCLPLLPPSEEVRAETKATHNMSTNKPIRA